jgi:hypothetical protein
MNAMHTSVSSFFVIPIPGILQWAAQALKDSAQQFSCSPSPSS